MSEHLERLRAGVDALPEPPAVMASYLDKVRVRAADVTDADVEALLEAGVSDDEIFEQTVAVAIREGLRRFEAAERVIG
jgi:alkylhydroperoxidase family enzyme